MSLRIEGQVERLNGKELSYKDFAEKYLKKNQPVVLTGLMDDWRACRHWVKEDGQPNLQFFSTHFGKSGDTSGIGAETARVLAMGGVRLVIPARDVKRAVEVREKILRERLPTEIIVMELDFASLILYRPFVLTLPLVATQYPHKQCWKVQQEART